MTRSLPSLGRIRVGAAAAAIVTFVLLGLTSCTVSLFPFLGEPASQLATTAAANWKAAAAHQVQGSFQTYGLDLTTDAVMATDAMGGTASGTADSSPYQFLEVGGKTYLKGQAFWQAYYSGNPGSAMVARGFRDNWTVSGDGNPIAAALSSLSSLDNLVKLLGDEAQHLKKGEQRTYQGRPLIALTDGNGRTWWTTQGSDGRVVRVVAATSESLSEVALTVAPAQEPHGLAARLTPPIIDPSQPGTLPALYQVVGQQQTGTCDQNGCPFDVTVENKGGAPAGPGVVTVTAYKDAGHTQQITTCTASIPASIPTNQTGTATCTLAGAAWSALVTANPSGGQFYAAAQIMANPPYL
jgi:hypothetical protein